MRAKEVLYFAATAAVMGIAILLAGCNQTVDVSAPSATVTDSLTSPLAVRSTPSATAWTWNPVAGNSIAAGSYAYFPASGGYVQAGQTLTLNWSSDGSLEGFIYTSTQFGIFINPLQVAATYLAHGSDSDGNISAAIQKSDSYYAVLRNNSLTQSVKLDQASLTAR